MRNTKIFLGVLLATQQLDEFETACPGLLVVINNHLIQGF